MISKDNPVWGVCEEPKWTPGILPIAGDEDNPSFERGRRFPKRLDSYKTFTGLAKRVAKEKLITP